MDNLGSLMPIELEDIPFEVKRIFTVTNCPAGQYRGGHAHKQTKQYLLCLQGAIRVMLIDKTGSKDFRLQRGCGVLVDTMIWDKIQFLTDNDVLLVMCNTAYDPGDYIEDFDLFKKMLSDENNGGNDRS